MQKMVNKEFFCESHTYLTHNLDSNTFKLAQINDNLQYSAITPLEDILEAHLIMM